MRLRQGATLDDPSLPHLPSSARGRPRVSPLGLRKWVRASSHLDGPSYDMPCILLPPQSARLSCWGFGCGGMYGPLTLDYNERARGQTLAVSLWLPSQRILKCSTKVCGHMHSTTRTDRSEPKDNGSRGHSNVQEWPKIPGGLTKVLAKLSA